MKTTPRTSPGSPARVVADPLLPDCVSKKIGSMQGTPLLQPGTLRSTMVSNSSTVGTRQSQCPAKHPSGRYDKSYGPYAPLSRPKKFVNTAPVGSTVSLVHV